MTSTTAIAIAADLQNLLQLLETSGGLIPGSDRRYAGR